MKKLATGLLAGTAALALSATTLSPAVAVPSNDAPAARDAARTKPDNRTSPQIRKQARLQAKARAMVENGSAKARTLSDGTQVVEVAEGEFAQLGVAGTDRIWTVLSEFGTQGSRKLGLTPGPLHNEIPKPDRSKDNSTTHEDDYSKSYFDTLFNGAGESMRNFYSAQSNGAYTVDVTTEDWVTVPGNASTYGDNAVEDAGRFVGLHQRHRGRMGGDVRQVRRRPRRLPVELRPVGPLRLRRGRQLQRGGRLHRPLPGRPRRRGRGGRRRPRRHLVAPLVRQPDHRRIRRPDRRRQGEPQRRRPDRRLELLHRRLHRRARERRTGRLRPRVRPRPRPARLLRHQRRRQRHVVLDDHVVRLVARPRRCGRGHRHPARHLRPRGEALPRLAQVRRGRQGRQRRHPVHVDAVAAQERQRLPGAEGQPEAHDHVCGLGGHPGR